MTCLKVCLGIFILAGSLWAQSEIRVYPASMAAGSTVAGKLVLLADNLVFVDDERPEASFSVIKTNIDSLSNDNGTITVQLRQGIRDRAGTATRLIVHMDSPEQGVDVQRWYGARESQTVMITGDDQGSSGDESTMTFSAQRKKRLRDNTDGKLIIDHERVIFESLDNASESRRWEMREIREFKLKNPFELEINTDKEKYNLRLSGAGMDNGQHREISVRITRARTAR
ncbi:MAG: hypothetical protein JXP48_11790 [Acidobacteria bacterium]|nr:hypothetical protein [Acidobacteriota bacterium]